MMIVYKENFSNRGAMCHTNFSMKEFSNIFATEYLPCRKEKRERENEKVLAILTLIMQWKLKFSVCCGSWWWGSRKLFS